MNPSNLVTRRNQVRVRATFTAPQPYTRLPRKSTVHVMLAATVHDERRNVMCCTWESAYVPCLCVRHKAHGFQRP